MLLERRRRPGPADPSLGAGRGAPREPAAGGDSVACTTAAGPAAPFWSRRASSLSRPRDLASWSWESRRSARGLVGAAVIAAGSPSSKEVPSPVERELCSPALEV